MKLFIILILASTGLSLLAQPREKIERKLASINIDSSKVASALSKNGFIRNSQSMVNDLTQTATYKCAEQIQNSELKDIEAVVSKSENKTYKFNAVRLCFDQSGPGVVEVRYDGIMRSVAGELQVSEVKIKLVQDSND